jgi:hypothetical protein
LIALYLACGAILLMTIPPAVAAPSRSCALTELAAAIGSEEPP